MQVKLEASFGSLKLLQAQQLQRDFLERFSVRGFLSQYLRDIQGRGSFPRDVLIGGGGGGKAPCDFSSITQFRLVGFEIFSTSPGINSTHPLKNCFRDHPGSKVIEVKLRSCSAVFEKKSCFR